MSKIISIISKIPNLMKELNKTAPKLIFCEILKESDYKQLYKSEIIIADFDLLIPHINYLENIKWIQGTWAGVDKFLPYVDHENIQSTIITRFSGKHFGRLMSEYVIANIINYEREMFNVYDNKKQKIWSQNDRISSHRSLADLTIGILGVGHIGNYIARSLSFMGAKIWGLGRRQMLPDDKEYQHYAKYCTVEELPILLQHCDYVINVLPSTEDTKGLLNGDMFQNCIGKKTIFINIGRGSIINESDLITALENKWLAGAILDVFENEPLAKESELWNLEQVFITPHVAGVSRSKDVAEQFVENLNLYENGLSIPTELQHGKKY